MKVILDHIVLNVENVKEAVNFYQNILELEIERFAEFEKGIVFFPSVRINQDTVIDLFPPKMWKTEETEEKPAKNNLNHLCLNLTEHEWQRLVDRLRIHDVKITRYADNNWGAKGIGISIYFNDPDGNEIEARYYPN